VEAVLDGPQVGRLAEEGGAVHPAQGREPVGPVAAEVLVQAAVGVDAEKLADAFDGQDLAVGQGGRRAAPAQGTGLTGEPVVALLRVRQRFGPILAQVVTTSSLPQGRPAANNRGKLIDRHSSRAQHYAARRGRISVEGVK
jgi:hypothetical protein